MHLHHTPQLYTASTQEDMAMKRYQHKLYLGDLAQIHSCPMCDGEGVQLELVWLDGNPNHDPEEHEVRCFDCHGYGDIVRLVCGRCGEESFAHPDESMDDMRQCACCGHEAPNALWLPMQPALQEEKTG